MLFIENKYHRWYYSIIQNAVSIPPPAHIYTEKHHIIPKCMGGSDRKDNIVRLTAREHFICHLLLYRMTSGQAKHKMAFALKMMLRLENKIRINSKTFEKIREYSSIATGSINRGRRMSEEQKDKLRCANLGKRYGKRTIEACNNISSAMKGKSKSVSHRQSISRVQKGKPKKPFTPEHKMNMCGPKSPAHMESIRRAASARQGVPLSETHRDRLSEAQMKIQKKECPHCGTFVRPQMYSRWHGDQCKFRIL